MTKVRQKREEVTTRSQPTNSIEATAKSIILSKTLQLKQMTEQDCKANNDDKLAKVKHHSKILKLYAHKTRLTADITYPMTIYDISCIK